MIEHSFSTSFLGYSKGWYNSITPYLERHNDIQNLKVILAYYTAVTPNMISNQDLLYMLCQTALPYWKQCSDYTLYQQLQSLVYVWEEYKNSDHCSLIDFDLLSEIIKSILTMIRMVPLKDQKVEMDSKLSNYLQEYYKHCRCPKCAFK